MPFLECLAGGLRPFRDLLVGETAAHALTGSAGECGVPLQRSGTQISR